MVSPSNSASHCFASRSSEGLAVQGQQSLEKLMFYDNRLFLPTSASQRLDEIPDIASVLLLDLNENVSVVATKHFFNELL